MRERSLLITRIHKSLSKLFSPSFGAVDLISTRMDPTPAAKVVRVRGWLGIVLGSSLIIGIPVIAARLASIVMHPDELGKPRWTGSHDFTAHVFELFATIFVFGLVVLAGGVFQLRRGRNSRLAMTFLIVLGVVMLLLFLQIGSAP